MPRILESDAIALARNIDSMPENQRPQAASILQQYKEQQEADGLPHWPQLMADQEQETKRFRSMFSELSNVDGVAPAIAPVVKYAADPDEHRARVASTAFLATRYGKPADEVASAWELYAGDYAAKNWNEATPLDSKRFYARAKVEIQGEVDFESLQKEALSDATLAAMDGDNPSTALSAWQAQALKKTGYKPELTNAYLAAYKKINAVLSPRRDKINGFIDALQRNSQGKAKGSDAETLQSFRDELLDMPKNEARLVLNAMAAKAKQAGEGQDMGIIRSMGEGLARFMTADTSFAENGLAEVPESPGLVSTSIAKITTPGEARAFVKEQATRNASQAFAAISSSGTAGIPQVALAGPERRLTDNEAMLVKEAKARAQKSIDMGREIRQMANATDPVGQISGSIGTSLGLMAATVGTGGAALPVVAQLYTASNYEQLRLEHPDINPMAARKIALVSGAAEAALDALDVKILGRMPSIASLLRGGWKRGLVTSTRNLGEAFVAENLQEAAQDSILPLVTALSSDAPSVNWRQDLYEYAAGRADVAVSLLPLILVGSGIATVHEIKAANKEWLNEQSLRAAGFTEKDRSMIHDAADTGNPEVLQSALQDAWGRRSPEIATEYRAQSDELQKAKEEFAAATNTEAEAQALSITHDESGWRLNMADGGTVRVDSAQAAVSLRSDLMQARTEDEARALVSVVEDWQKSAPAGTMRETNFTGEQVKLGSDGQLIGERAGGDVRVIDNPGLLQSIRSQAQSTGLGAEIDLVVNGSNSVFAQSVNEASRQIIQRLEINRSDEQPQIITVLHEQLEANLKAANLGGIIDPQETMNALARVADALPVAAAQQRLAALERRGAPQVHIDEARREVDLRQRLQAVASGQGDEAAMREIAVELAVADVIARDKSGMRTGFQAGSVSAALDSAISKAVTPGEVRALGKFRAFLRSVRAWVRSVLGTVAGFQKAKRDGKLTDGDAWNSWLDKVTGVTEQARYDQELADELKAIAGQDEAQYSGPSEGMAFSLSRAVPEDVSNLVQMPDGAQLVGPTTFSISEYGIQHRPNDEGPRAFDLAEGDMMPKDVYEHPEWYSAMDGKVIRETMAQLRKVRGKPDALVDIFRAGPVGEMNQGDWVSLSKEYARTHAESQDPDGYKVWTAKVPAKEVRWDMNDIAEFGYFGDNIKAVDSGVSFSITAYHGTPHKVDRFSLDKIGTGEGAQAYGWGLYFAERQDVAEGYQSRIAGAQWVDKTGRSRSALEIGEAVYEQARKDGYSVKDADELRSYWSAYAQNGGMQNTQGIESIRAVVDGQGIKLKRSGNLYTVELLPDADEFLDWDKPLSEQSEKVKAVFLKAMKEGAMHNPFESATPMSGREGYNWFSAIFGQGEDSQKSASEYMAELGIPGIKYLDGGSRGAGDGTRNYVIFDENLVRILEENGKPVEARSFSLSRVTPAQDAEYMRAVESGDMETAQRMVDEAAEAAGYNEKAFHGTNKEFDAFSRDSVGSNRDNGFLGTGFYFSTDEAVTKGKRRSVAAYLKLQKPLRIQMPNSRSLASGKVKADEMTKALGIANVDASWVRNKEEGVSYLQISKSDADRLAGTAIGQGYDGVILDYSPTGYNQSEMVVFDPNQIKSADPVTRDESGNVIPLSQRFNPADNRITFSLSPSKQGASVGSMASQDQAAQTPSSSPGGLTEADVLYEKLSQDYDDEIDLKEPSFDPRQKSIEVEFDGRTWDISISSDFLFRAEDVEDSDNWYEERLDTDLSFSGDTDEDGDVPANIPDIWEKAPASWWETPETNPDDKETWAEDQPAYAVQTNDGESGWQDDETFISLRQAVDSYSSNESEDKRLIFYNGKTTHGKDRYGFYGPQKSMEVIAQPSFVQKLLRDFPGMTKQEAVSIAATRNEDNTDTFLVAQAYARHTYTNYDDRLQNARELDEDTSIERSKARYDIKDTVAEIMQRWKTAPKNDEAAKVSQGGFQKQESSKASAVGGNVATEISPQPGQSVNPSFHPPASTEGASMSLSPARNLELVQSAIDTQLSRDPDKRLKLAANAMQKLEALRSRWMEEGWTSLGHYKRPLVEKRGKASLDKEQSMRQATRERELLDLGMNSLSQQEAETYFNGLMKLEEHPLVFAMLNDNGRLMSRTTAEAQGKLKTDGAGNAGDYDSAPWLPPSWYRNGGGIMPEEMAQALYDDGKLKEPTADALWSALSSVIESHRKNKAAFAEAEAAVKVIEKAAKDQAKAEAQAWRDEYDARQSKDWNPRAALVRDLQLLDSVLSVMPPEVRGKVGGFVKLAQLATEDARVKEITRRIDKLEKFVEAYVREHFAVKIEKSFERYKGQKDKSGRVSGKLIASATEQVDYAFAVSQMDAEAQAKESALLEKTIQESDDSEAVHDALSRIGILRLFEALDVKDSAALESAAKWLDSTVQDGKLGKKILDEARKEFLDELRESAQSQILEGEALNIDDANNLSNMNRAPMRAMVQRLRGMLSEALWTTAQRLELIFGENSKATDYFASRAVDAANRSNDIKRGISAQQRDVLKTIFNSDSKFAHARGIAKLQESRKSGVMVRRVTTKDVVLDLETLTKLSDGTMTPEAAGIRADELQTALDEWAANANKRSVTVTQVVSLGEPTERFMSELQGIQWRLWWNQADSKKQMERDGWNDDSIKQLEAFLSPEAKALGSWISKSYQDAAKMIDPIYRRLFNAPLPRVKGYAPIYRMTLSTDADMMDLSNSDMNSGLAASFTKSRVNTTAPLLEIDALAAFLSHWENVSHWVSHAELIRDMKAVLMDRNVSTAIRQKKGDGVLSRLKEDIQTIEKNGTNSAKELTNLSRGWRWLMQYRAYKGLAFRLSPVIKQTPALLNPMLADVPAHNYAAGLARAFASPQEFADDVSAMWNSDTIKRRIEGGFSAEARIAQQGASISGSQAIALMQAGMMPMSYVDAGWTALGSAVAYDYYKRSYIAQNEGATPEMADRHATARLERMIATSAQPSDIVNRSLYERSSNPFMRSMTMFVSDQRKALAIEVMAIRRLATGKSSNKALDVQRALVAHFIQAAVSQVIAGALASMLGDDDDKEREWSVEQWTLALSLGPVNGLFVLGRLIDKVGRTLINSDFYQKRLGTGQTLPIFPSDSLAGKAADDLIRGTKRMDELFSPEDAEDVMTSLDALSAAVGSAGSLAFGPAAGVADVSANAVREVAKVAKSLSQ